MKVPSLTIDGDLSDWSQITEISMADNSGRGGGLDNTAKVKLAWNDTYLFAAYNVTDTDLLAVQTARDNGEIFKDDEVELYIDPQGDGGSASSMTATDYQFLANVREALGDQRGNGTGGKDASYNAASFLAQAVPNGTLNAAGADVGYTVELRVAWSDLGVTPAVGHFMRLDVAVGDRDGSAPPPVQSFDWAGLTLFNNPSGWKDVQLVDAPPPSDYDIVKVPSMTIDGALGDWAGIAAISIADTSGRAAGLDNTAQVKLAWNDTYLFAAYDVTDTDLLAVQTARDNGNIFRDDEIELYIDPQGDGGSASSMTTTDYQFLANIQEALGDQRGNGTGGKDASYNAASFLAQVVANGTVNAAGADVGYTLELRIAWADLGVSPAAGKFMRLDVAVGDRDGSAPPPVESFDWAGLTLYNNPSGWKGVRLAADGPPPTPAGIPFGLFALHPDTLASGTIWTGAAFSSKNPNSLLADFEAAETKSPRIGVWVVMTGGNETVFRNQDGSFNLARWKDSLDRAHGGNIQPNGRSSWYDDYLPYIQNGTFQGIILLDDLAGFDPYPTRAQIEGMAAHAKLRFPALPTVVRERATELENRFGSTPYTSLDAAWAQYRSDRGTAASYRDLNIAAAQRLQLGLVLGINAVHGLRTVPGGTTVPADSLLKWGNEFLKPGNSDYACGFFMWDTDYAHVSHPNMTTLANKASTHVSAPCKRR